MSQQRRLKIVGIELDHTVQRLHEELSLSHSAEFNPDTLWIELDAAATQKVYVGWGSATGAKPLSIDATNGLPLVAGQQRAVESPNGGQYPRPDFRQLCFQGHADDDGLYVTVSWYEIITAVNPT